MARKSKSSNAIGCSPMEDKMWRARSALDTLTRADEIRADKSLMADVKKAAREQAKTLDKVLKPAKRS